MAQAHYRRMLGDVFFHTVLAYFLLKELHQGCTLALLFSKCVNTISRYQVCSLDESMAIEEVEG